MYIIPLGPALATFQLFGGRFSSTQASTGVNVTNGSKKTTEKEGGKKKESIPVHHHSFLSYQRPEISASSTLVVTYRHRPDLSDLSFLAPPARTPTERPHLPYSRLPVQTLRPPAKIKTCDHDDDEEPPDRPTTI